MSLSVPAATHAPDVVLVLTLTSGESSQLLDMASEFAHGEFELAEDLQRLGRPIDEQISRAALGIRLAAAAASAGGS